MGTPRQIDSKMVSCSKIITLFQACLVILSSVQANVKDNIYLLLLGKIREGLLLLALSSSRGKQSADGRRRA